MPATKNLEKFYMSRPVANIATLKAINTTSVVTGLTAIVNDYGLYVFNSTSTATADDIDIVAPTTGPGRWNRTESSVVLNPMITAQSDADGAIYYDSVANKFQFRENGAWVGLAEDAGLVTSPNSTSLVGGVTDAHDNTAAAGNTVFGMDAAKTGGSGAVWNTAIGTFALEENVSSDANTAVGYQSLQKNLASYNAAVGAQALGENTTGEGNTAVGSAALRGNSTASYGTAVGTSALAVNSTGPNNTAVGYRALVLNDTGGSNTAVGYQSLFVNVSGSQNTAVGALAADATTSTGNTAVGYRALTENTTGTSNTAVGLNAAATLTAVSDTTAVGANALTANTSGESNTAVGSNALTANTTGADNIAIGYSAASKQTTASFNVALGSEASRENITGTCVTAIGTDALFYNTASYNTAVGTEALKANQTGANDTAVGFRAAYANKGSRVTAIGKSALAAATTGGTNTAIGNDAGSDVVAQTNVTLLGHDSAISTHGDNSCVVGNSTQTVYMDGLGLTLAGPITATNIVTTSPAYGEMYNPGDNSSLFSQSISETNVYVPAVDTMLTGLLSNFTFVAFSMKVIASVADGGSGTCIITTATNHGYTTGNIVSIRDCAGYSGQYVVDVTGLNTYKITHAFSSTQTGYSTIPPKLICGVSGKYKIDMSMNLLSVDTDLTIDNAIFINTNASLKMMFTSGVSATSPSAASGTAIFDLTAGDIIWLGVRTDGTYANIDYDGVDINVIHLL